MVNENLENKMVKEYLNIINFKKKKKKFSYVIF